MTVSGGVRVSTLPIVVLNESPRSSARYMTRFGRVLGRRLGGAVRDELEAEQEAAAAHVADQRAGALHLVQARQRQGADPRGVLDQALVLDDLDGGERRAAVTGFFSCV